GTHVPGQRAARGPPGPAQDARVHRVDLERIAEGVAAEQLDAVDLDRAAVHHEVAGDRIGAQRHAELGEAAVERHAAGQAVAAVVEAHFLVLDDDRLQVEDAIDALAGRVDVAQRDADVGQAEAFAVGGVGRQAVGEAPYQAEVRQRR